MAVRHACPACGSQQFKKNAHIHNGKNYRCTVCGGQFVLHAENRVVAEERCTLAQHLLREKILLHGICRAVGASIRWLTDFLVARFEALPDHLNVRPAAYSLDVVIERLDVEADEMCSFVTMRK
jgi:hypothetical protein